MALAGDLDTPRVLNAFTARPHGRPFDNVVRNEPALNRPAVVPGSGNPVFHSVNVTPPHHKARGLIPHHTPFRVTDRQPLEPHIMPVAYRHRLAGSFPIAGLGVDDRFPVPCPAPDDGFSRLTVFGNFKYTWIGPRMKKKDIPRLGGSLRCGQSAKRVCLRAGAASCARLDILHHCTRWRHGFRRRARLQYRLLPATVRIREA